MKRNRTQKQCDNLLTPIIKALYPQCLLCGQETQVAHHHCHKSKSLLLRYDLKNLINLCNSCHLKLHWNESYWASIIVKKRGMAWFNYIEKQKNKPPIKIDYNKIYDKLKKLYPEKEIIF